MKNKYMKTSLTILLSLLLLVGISVLPFLHNHRPHIFNDGNCQVSVIENVLSGSSITVPIKNLFQNSVIEFISIFATSQVKLNSTYPASLNRAPPVV